MENKLCGVCFGEILFDVFPGQKIIGGAPLNVALRINAFGGDIAIISAVGNDTDGKIIVEYLDDLGIKTETIQIKKDYPTGMVYVTLDEKGNASYDINYPAAWDKIESSNDGIESVKKADFFVYGSLSSRDSVSRVTLKSLLTVAKYKIFDVNLRANHYNNNDILDLLYEADLLKCNDDELNEICAILNSNEKSLEQNIRFIAEKTNSPTVCVTLGANGAVLYYKNKFYYNSGFKVNVVDTVGSGDSFLAALIILLLNGKEPQYTIDFACAVGSIVAQSEGANPVILQSQIEAFLSGYQNS